MSSSDCFWPDFAKGVIALYGGSFNPVHKGHVALVEQMLRAGEADQIWVLPTSRSPMKEAADTMPAELRWKMVQLAFQDLENVEILDHEIWMQGAAYTIDTVRNLQTHYSDVSFALIMGQENFRTFDQWKGAKELLELVRFWIVNRGGRAMTARQKQELMFPAFVKQWYGDRWSYDSVHQQVVDSAEKVRIRWFHVPTPQVSSSEIRKGALSEESIPDVVRSLYQEFCESLGSSQDSER